jgi:hypothetical protein
MNAARLINKELYMNEQIKAIFSVIIHPKQTMQGLPSDRIFLLAFLSPIYFAIARVFRPRNHDALLAVLGGNWQIILAVIIFSLVMVPVGAWLLRQFLKLFKKRLSVRKIMNINGYSYVPRLAVALVGYAVISINPSIFESARPTPELIAVIVLGVFGMIYTLYLCVYGIIVSPSEQPLVANKDAAL